jgi:hypothetical protein
VVLWHSVQYMRTWLDAGGRLTRAMGTRYTKSFGVACASSGHAQSQRVGSLNFGNLFATYSAWIMVGESGG